MPTPPTLHVHISCLMLTILTEQKQKRSKSLLRLRRHHHDPRSGRSSRLRRDGLHLVARRPRVRRRNRFPSSRRDGETTRRRDDASGDRPRRSNRDPGVPAGGGDVGGRAVEGRVREGAAGRGGVDRRPARRVRCGAGGESEPDRFPPPRGGASGGGRCCNFRRKVRRRGG